MHIGTVYSWGHESRGEMSSVENICFFFLVLGHTFHHHPNSRKGGKTEGWSSHQCDEPQSFLNKLSFVKCFCLRSLKKSTLEFPSVQRSLNFSSCYTWFIRRPHRAQGVSSADHLLLFSSEIHKKSQAAFIRHCFACIIGHDESVNWTCVLVNPNGGVRCPLPADWVRGRELEIWLKEQHVKMLIFCMDIMQKSSSLRWIPDL